MKKKIKSNLLFSQKKKKMCSIWDNGSVNFFFFFYCFTFFLLIFYFLTKISNYSHWQECMSISMHACVCMLCCFSHSQLFATLWTIACQAPLSMGFSRQGYRSGWPCRPPEDLPDPWIEPLSLMSWALADSTAWQTISVHMTAKIRKEIHQCGMVAFTQHPWSGFLIHSSIN